MFPVPIIEKLSLVAPLGLCFHDAATGERVSDGLAVSIYPAAGALWKKRAVALPNRSGVFVFHRAAGLEEFARGSGDDEFWAKFENRKKRFIAEVIDRESRFQPFRFTLELPVRGVYRWQNIPPTSPVKDLGSIPLYSSPSRKIFGGMSVIRAELRESVEKAASFAVLEARLNGRLVARGIADRSGSIALIFPALAPPNNPLASPPADATRVSLADQQWNLDLTIKYEPRIFQTSPPSPVENESEVLPDLRLVLAQANGRLWANSGKTESFTTAVLRFGSELVLRSRASQSSPPAPAAETVFKSSLFVSPA